MLSVWKLNSRLPYAWLLALGSLCLAACQLHAADWSLESAGVRYGFSANGSGSDFHASETFLNANLPWSWSLGTNWQVASRLDGSAGWLGAGDKNGAMFTLGPTLVLSRKNLPITLDGGVSPTVITRSQYDTKDLGIPFQFTTHIGINWDFAKHFRAGYRFQHMSNAHLSNHNPGLNLHLFGVSYLF
jgi:hypothetical protein